MTTYVIMLPLSTSVNDAYRHVGNVAGRKPFRVKTKAYNEWIKLVTENHLPRHVRRGTGKFNKKGEEEQEGIYSGHNRTWALHLEINTDHKRDISNCYKTTEDVLAGWFGLKDAFNNDGRFIRERNTWVVQPGWMRCVLTVEDDDGTVGQGDRAAPTPVSASGDRGAGEEEREDGGADDEGAGGDRHRQRVGKRVAKRRGTHTATPASAILAKRRRFRKGLYD